MYKIEDIVNTIICGDTRTELQKIPSESINISITSPPYWGLRDYQAEPQIWDGNEKCKHEWKIERTNRANSSGGRGEFSKKQQTVRGSIMTDYNNRATYSDFCSLCGAWRGSLGLEPTFELYLKHLFEIFDEVKRVLKSTGTIFINLGDSYSGGKGSSSGYYREEEDENRPTLQKKQHYLGGQGITRPSDGKIGVPPKSLCLIPQHFAIGMVDRGWILRNTIIWYKRNCMPSSVKDRFTVDFEYIFFFVKSNDPQYWINIKTGQISKKKPLGLKGIEGIDWDWKEVLDFKKETEVEGQGTKTKRNISPDRKSGGHYSYGGINSPFSTTKGLSQKLPKKLKKVSNWRARDYWFEQQYDLANYDGRKDTKYKGGLKDMAGGAHERWIKDINGRHIRNRRCVWDIPTRPFKGAHFAVFPEALVKPMILSGCPEFVCKKCGMAREKIYRTDNPSKNFMEKDERCQASIGFGSRQPVKSLHRNKGGVYSSAVYKGYTDCECNAGFEGGIVLDPFMGRGTSGVVAKEFNRKFIGIDINPKYCKMSERGILNTTGSLF